jgi:hypothetical protein
MFCSRTTVLMVFTVCRNFNMMYENEELAILTIEQIEDYEGRYAFKAGQVRSLEMWS